MTLGKSLDLVYLSFPVYTAVMIESLPHRNERINKVIYVVFMVSTSKSYIEVLMKQTETIKCKCAL